MAGAAGNVMHFAQMTSTPTFSLLKFVSRKPLKGHIDQAVIQRMYPRKQGGSKMRTIVYVIGSLLLSACATYGPYSVSTYLPYGSCCVPYGDGRQPGVAFTVPVGTPVIAPSDGIVIATGENVRFGGHFVRVAHGNTFDTYNTHLSRVMVTKGQAVSRGQLIGFSGGDHTGRTYLHFGLCKKGGSCISFPDSIDPHKHWLGGSLRCFEPRSNYSQNSQTELTVPLACDDHARELIARSKAEISK